MMFASKMPALRMDKRELKCKNGCDYFGNPQWQGYCSKCHREQMQRQRRAEKVSSTSATLPKPEQKKDKGIKLASHSSFSKFEEKRLRQSETKTKANLLKFSVFKKATSATDEQDHSDKRSSGYKIPPAVNEGMKRDFRARFPTLPSQVDRDSRVFARTLIMDVVKCAHALTIDELSERVQIQYQRFMKHMETSAHFASVDADTRELLMDFVEKHAMSYLHELPSMVFSPHGTEDERLDRVMSERIQQLGWVGERHLECKLDRSSAACRRLLYKAISELLGMDSALSPGGKLSRARRACRHVLALCAAPASADDLLPALIFTVLKANPPRLISNINFVTRFCNAQRLMTGEGGYYFTNLCCAVSFIENLNAESLNMDKKEFDCYMAMPASIGGSAWAAALSLCGAAREAEALRGATATALQAARDNEQRAIHLATSATHFKEQIAKKVADVLAKTPLEIKPRRELPRLDRIANLAPLIDLNTGHTLKESETMPSEHTAATEEPDTNIEIEQSNHPQEPTNIELVESNHPQLNKELVESSHPQDPTNIELVESNNPPEIERESLLDKINSPIEFATTIDVPDNTEVPEEPKKTLDLENSDQSPAKSPQHLDWDSKQNNSMELLTPSPLGYTPFDSRSLDELMTPEEFGDHLAPGLSNINYDIDLSDFSGDNSIAEDAPKIENDPFSPEGLKVFDPFAPQADSFVLQADSVHPAHSFVHHSNSSTHQADSFRHQPDSFSHQSDSFSHQAGSFSRQAGSFSRQTDPFALKVDPLAPQIDPFSPQLDSFQPVLQAFDEFSLVDSRNRGSDPFQMVPKARDPFSPIETTTASSPERNRTSILDDSDSPTAACLLPSPLLPQSSGKK